MIVDVHTHTPTHRDAVPPEDVVENDKWRPDRVVRATSSWADYDEAASAVDASIAFTIARDRERVDPAVNDGTAAFVAAAPERRLGFLSVHPEVPGALDEVERAAGDLGLVGIKLGPNYQSFDPLAEPALRLYELAQSRGLPVLFHTGTSPVADAPLRHAHPLLFDEVAIRFPELRVVLAHLGHPWQRDAIAVIRKHPHVYADVSALFYRAWSFWECMRLATEWNVLGKLLLGSDFPIATPAETIAGLRAVNAPVAGTGLPPVPLEPLEELIARDSLSLLGLAQPRAREQR
jgi:predicted TIM-barrel fold metal-dependent hydrolase